MKVLTHLLLCFFAMLMLSKLSIAQSYTLSEIVETPNTANIPSEIIVLPGIDVVYAIEDVGAPTIDTSHYALLVSIDPVDLTREVLFDTRKEDKYRVNTIETLAVLGDSTILVAAFTDASSGSHLGVFLLDDMWHIDTLLASIQIEGIMSYADKDCIYIHHLGEYHCNLAEDQLFTANTSYIKVVLGPNKIKMDRMVFPVLIGGKALTYLDTNSLLAVVDRRDSLLLVDADLNLINVSRPVIQYNGSTNVMPFRSIQGYRDSTVTLVGYQVGFQPTRGELLTWDFNIVTGEANIIATEDIGGGVLTNSMKYNYSDLGGASFFTYENSTVDGIGDTFLWIYDSSGTRTDTFTLGQGPGRIICAELLNSRCIIGSAILGFSGGSTKFVYWKACKPTSSYDQQDIQQSSRIYPNPAQSQVWLESSLLQNGSLQLYSTGGAEVQTQVQFMDNERAMIDVHSLPAGVYIVVISNINGVWQDRLVVVK